jgi:hypothetical protein
MVMSLGRPILNENRMTHVTLTLDADTFQIYRNLQEKMNSNASAGIRKFIKNFIMQNQN